MSKDFFALRCVVHLFGLAFVVNSVITYGFVIFEVLGVEFDCISTAVTSPKCNNALVEWGLDLSGTNIMLRIYTFGAGLILDVIAIVYLVIIFNSFFEKLRQK